MTIAEMKACWEAEKSKALSDLKKKLQKEKEDAVADAKKKQWVKKSVCVCSLSNITFLSVLMCASNFGLNIIFDANPASKDVCAIKKNLNSKYFEIVPAVTSVDDFGEIRMHMVITLTNFLSAGRIRGVELCSS